MEIVWNRGVFFYGARGLRTARRSISMSSSSAVCSACTTDWQDEPAAQVKCPFICAVNDAL